VTQIAARDQRHRPCHAIGRRAYALAKPQVVFIRKEAVSESNHSPIPAIAIEEIKRDGRAVIERIIFEVEYFVIFLRRAFGDGCQHFLIEWRSEEHTSELQS